MMYQKLIVAPQRAWIALLTALVLAGIHQYLFYGHAIGVSYPVFIILFYLYMYTYGGDRLRQGSAISRLWMTAIMLLSLTYALFANPLFAVLNLLAVPVLIVLHTTYMLSERRPAWSSAALGWAAVAQVVVHMFAHLPTPIRMLYHQLAKRMEKERRRILVRIVIGIIVALPLLLVVLLLLTSADRMFDELLSNLPSWLIERSPGPVLFRIAWIGVMMLVLFAYLWGFVHPLHRDPQSGRYMSEKELAAEAATRAQASATSTSIPSMIVNAPLESPRPVRLDPIVAATVLVLVNLVYMLFVWLQFSYLFGGGHGRLPDGSTYAEYARSGFGELVIVTAINFTVLLSVLYKCAPASPLLMKVNRWLLYVLVICSAVMLSSAFTRLMLYEQAYGYTVTRFLVHVFMLFLGVLLVLAGLRIHFSRLPLYKCFLILGLSVYVVLNYAGMESWIAERNIERYAESGQLDHDYLIGLSADAVPTLLAFADEHPQLGLTTLLRQSKRDILQQDQSWQEFNWSTYLAARELR